MFPTKAIRKSIFIFFYTSLACFISFLAIAAEVPKAPSPAVITSLGQSPDGYTAKVLANMAKVQIDYNALMTADEVPNYKTLIMAVGASLKGFGSAGVNLDSEVERGRKIIAAVKKNNVFLVIMHTGGEARREQMSNLLLDNVAHQADYLLVLQDSNNDKYFTKLAEKKNIRLTEVKKYLDLKAVFKEMFSGE
jgi:hypothetical protein